MLLENYLKPKGISLNQITRTLNYSKEDIAQWDVIEYPDELLYVLSQLTKKKISVLLYELLNLESPLAVRQVSEDYSLLRSFEGEMPYIFITPEYRNKQTKFITDVLVQLDIYELDLGPFTKFNIIGKAIYEAFLLSVAKSEEYKRIEEQLGGYFVLVHDEDGSLLCKIDYLRNKEWQLTNESK